MMHALTDPSASSRSWFLPSILRADYPGAMFPWESAYTGLGVQQTGLFDTLEQHITADVGLAVRLFYETHVRSTEAAAKSFLTQMWPLLNGTCIFWDARLEPKSGGGATSNYTVKGVVGPDESSGARVRR